MLANNCLEVCQKIKYIGHCITDDMNDDDDDDISYMHRQTP